MTTACVLSVSKPFTREVPVDSCSIIRCKTEGKSKKQVQRESYWSQKQEVCIDSVKGELEDEDSDSK